jgi:predicted ArsR family transcriptional regulator
MTAGIMKRIRPAHATTPVVENDTPAIRQALLSQREQILIMAGTRKRGVTSYEVGEKLGISTQLAAARLQEMRAEAVATKGNEALLVVNGTTRPSPSGRPCQVHYLTDAGKDACDVVRKAKRSASTAGLFG